ncbi:hypothetical protein [Micromonospora sp. NPDC005806]|uniref:hypothetical protein n=1 Tax=Micromonospora sp. NPDC005806 TaxID=3364234 RepID=UPI0036B08413
MNLHGGRPASRQVREDAPAQSAHRGEAADAIKVVASDNLRNAVLAGVDTIEPGPSEVYPDLICRDPGAT